MLLQWFQVQSPYCQHRRESSRNSRDGLLSNCMRDLSPFPAWFTIPVSCTELCETQNWQGVRSRESICRLGGCSLDMPLRARCFPWKCPKGKHDLEAFLKCLLQGEIIHLEGERSTENVKIVSSVCRQPGVASLPCSLSFHSHGPLV